MALVDLKSKQSLLGLNKPISDMTDKIGPKFANYRNFAHGIGPEPDSGEEEASSAIDTIAERSLTQNYFYSYGSPYAISQTNIPPSHLDLHTEHEEYKHPEQPIIDL